VTEQPSGPSEPHTSAPSEVTTQQISTPIAAPAETGTDTGTTPAPAKKRHRAALISGVGLGYAVLAVGAAVAVVAIASPAPVNIAALSSPTTTAATATVPAIPPVPGGSGLADNPTSNVTGSVSDGIHHGDLRFFLLPPPQGPSTVQGNPAGTVETEAEVVSEYGSGYTKQNLSQLDFTGGATRTYQDSTLGANITIELLQFATHNDAQAWLGVLSKPSGTTSVTIPGESGSVGWLQNTVGNYQLNGTYVEGDTFYNITIYSTQEIGDGSLIGLMDSQYSRLSNG
jgi:hypothetical protein